MPQLRDRTPPPPPTGAGLRPTQRRPLLLRTVAMLVLMLGASTALAQLLYLPPSEFGKPFPNVPHGAGHPSPMAIFGGEPTYEPFRAFAQSERYGSIGRAVGRLDLLVEDVQRAGPALTYCTATLISEDVIVTNYHCVPGINPEVTILAAELRMGLHHDPDEPGEAFQIADLRPLDALRDLDFVLLRVRGSPGRTYGYVRLDPRDPRDDEPLFIIHHSLGLPKMLTRRNCTVFQSESAASVAGQAGGPNTVRYDPDTDVTHRCDAQGGSSGALVFSQIDDRVVGLHFAGTRDEVPPDRRFNLFKRFTLIAERSAVLASIVVGDTRPPPPSPPPALPILSITSVPAGASVLVGNRVYGVTPIDVEFTSVGSATITLQLSGFDDHTSDVIIQPGRNHHAVTLTATGLPVPPTADCMTPTDYRSNTTILHTTLRTEGGTARLCEGVFEFPGTMDIRQDTTIIGAGQGRTVLRLRPDARVVRSGVIEVLLGAHVEFRDLTIEGNGLRSDPQSGLHVFDGTAVLTNVTVRGARIGLDIVARSAAHFRGSTTFDAVLTGVRCARGAILIIEGSLLERSGTQMQLTNGC